MTLTVLDAPALVIDAEFKALIPALTAEEEQQLEANLLAEGCRDALVVWAGHNILIDGHNRYAICQRYGLPYPTVEREFASREDVIVWIIQNQFGRRNLTSFVRAELALKLKSAIAAKAKLNQRATQFGNAVLQNFAEPVNRIDTRQQLAHAADVSHETIRKVEAVTQSAPEQIKDAARNGQLSIDRAYKVTRALSDAPAPIQTIVTQYAVDDPDVITELKRLEKDAPDTFGEIVTSGYIQPGEEVQAVHISDGYKAVKEALKEKSRIHAQMAMDERRARAAETPLPVGKYRCIVIDPPWPVEKIEREVRPHQGQHLPYPTMTLAEIAALPVADYGLEDGCHLYLWATQKYLPDALRLMEGWGFSYQCVMTWVKPTGMTPYSWMYNTELVLFGRRGSLPLEQNGLKLSFEAPSTEHSAKPDIFYTRVLAASPEPRLEMFARRRRAGFTSWGDEL
ncbi:MAG: hypothetical protein K8L97_01540 [Anaerolineae bacterium]|nr:hypothetical protein [Anaerolineae bacterium]